MNLCEYENFVQSTSPEDWTVITCWGDGGPVDLGAISPWTRGTASSGIEINSHGMRASLKKNLDVWIAWGFTWNDDYREDWANSFPDSRASGHLVDFYCNSSIVFRDRYVTVDGSRCKLPMPNPLYHTSGATTTISGYTISRKRYEFFMLLNNLEGMINDYQNYVSRSGFSIIEESWMV